MDWESLVSDAETGDTKQRLAVLPALQDYVENNSLGRDEVADLVRVSDVLVKDHNFKICQGTLQVLHAAVLQDGDAFKGYANALIPPTVEKLGDSKQTVRDSAQRLLIALSEILDPGLLLEKVAWAWTHKNQRVREELANTITIVFQNLGFGSITAAAEKQLLFSIISVMEDPTASVREAAVAFLGEMYCQTGDHLVSLLKQFDIRPAQQREIDNCFADIDPIQHGVERANAAPKNHTDKSSSGKSDKSGSSGSSRPGSARPSQNGKRGGFGDAGGLTADGELPPVEVVPVTSESDFKSKCAKLLPQLDVKNDWDSRIKAMLQLEGMVLGGAAQLNNFLDELRNLKDAVTEQLNDRRSAVSRVACHLLAELAISLGNKFEPLAVHFLPFMMKVSVISVQVMADAANEAMATVVQHCRAKGAVVQILSAVISERNKVMRTNCSKLLLLMLEVWDRKTFERHLDLVEKSISAAVQDAQADVRTNGRLCYGAYAQACPDRVTNYLKKLQPALREKMLQAGAEYIRQSSPTGAPPNPPSQMCPPASRPVSAPVRRDSDAGMKPASARSTVAGGALRCPAAEEPHDEVPNRRLSSARAGPARVPAQQSHRPAAAPAGSARPTRVSDVGPRRVFERDLPMDDVESASYNGSSAISNAGSSAHSRSLGAVLKKIRSAKGQSDWEKKRDGFHDLRDWVMEHGPSAGHELSKCMDKLVPIIMDSTKDAHHQVVVASLEAWAETAKYGSKAMEPYLERLMGCAFLRVVDAKASIRNAAQAAMLAVGDSFAADVLLMAITRSLAVTKSAKGKVAVMEYSAATLGAGTTAGPPSRGAALSAWVEACANELADRNPDVRKLAGSALEHVYKSIDSLTVLAFITGTTAQAAANVKRALARGVPDLAAELVTYQRGGGASFAGPDAERNRRLSMAGRSAPQSPSHSPTGKKPSLPSWQEAEQLQSPPGPLSPDSPSTVRRMQQKAADICKAATGVHIEQAPSVEAGRAVAPTPALAPNMPQHSAQPTSSAREAAPTHIDHQQHGCGTPPPGEKASKHDSSVAVFVSSAPADAAVPGASAPLAQPTQHQPGYATPPQHHMPAYSTYAANAYLGTPCSTPGSEAPHPPLDPAVAEARLRMLVGRLSAQGGPAPDTLIGIQDMARGACEPAWQACFSQVLLGMLRVIDTCNEHIQEFAVEALREMTFHQTSLFVPHLDLVVPLLLNLSQQTRQVAIGADDCMEQLVKRASPEQCLGILVSRLPVPETQCSGTAADGMVLQACIRNVGRAVACLPTAELMLRVPDLLPGLFESFRNISADVRKAVVFCLVDMYLVIGDQLMPLLSPLSTSQLKLVTIYVNRAAQRLDRPPPMVQV